jgi:hypothetical protein
MIGMLRNVLLALLALFPVLSGAAQRTEGAPRQRAGFAGVEDIQQIVARPHILFRNTAPGPMFGRLAVVSLDDPGGERVVTPVTCARVSFGGGRGLCLQVQRGVFNTYRALLLDGRLNEGPSLKLEGLPSRTRTSPNGRVGAVTVFVLGDGYATDFSTRTTLIDLSTGDVVGQLEEFSTWQSGEQIRAVDFNFWGVTFERNGNGFYAALRTAGKTFLVRGDLRLRKLTVLRENVECPSLSPDNTRLAYKKRVGPSPDSWRLHVLDLETGAERLIGGEERYIDDQVEWLDSTHVLYGVPRRTTSMSDVWVASIDGQERARLFLSQAESPIVVR